jgi:transglutaminase-like putative cysteine protease
MVRQEAGAASSVERFFQFSLLGLVASGFLAVAGSGYLDAPTIVWTSAGLLLRAVLLGSGREWRPSRRAIARLLLAYGGFLVADCLAISRQAAPVVVHLVFFLGVLQVVTAASRRGYLATAALSFAGLAAGAVLSLSSGFLLALVLYLGFGVAVLISAEIRRSLRKAPAAALGVSRGLGAHLAALAASVASGIVALTAGIFLLSPHGAGSALGSLLFHRMSLPGFSRRVSLGEIGQFRRGSRAAMHVRLYAAEPAGGLKWRGGALTGFDGQQWSNPGAPEVRLYTDQGRLDLVPTARRRLGRHIVYDVLLDAIDSDALFFAGVPEHVDVRTPYLLGAAASGFRLVGRPPQGFRYEAYSLLEDPPAGSPPVYPLPALDSAERSRCLQLPKLDPRIAELARRFAAGAATDLEKAQAVERRLRGGYGYTLDAPRHRPADPLADFLFTRKKGHCEYFASSMAVLLRTQGIPTRLATGFQSGTYNQLTGLWLVRSSDAHAWVEAWIPERGWTTFDPTPPGPAPGSSVATRLTLYLDAADGLWREWVVSYDPYHQGSLMDRVQQSAARLGIRWFDTLSDAHTYWDGPAGKRLRRLAPRLLAAIGLGVLLWLAIRPAVAALGMRRRERRVRRGQAAAGDAALLYRRMLQILKRRGYRKPPWFTPAEFAASLPRTRLGDAAGEFTAAYNAWRFGGRTELAPRLSALLQELRRAGRGSR